MADKIRQDLPQDIHTIVDGSDEFRKFDYLFKPNNSVLIVGNGPVTVDHNLEVDKFDVVVRMNFYPEHAFGTGNKTDIHLSNMADGKKTIEELKVFRKERHLEKVLGLSLECFKFQLNYDEELRTGGIFPIKERWMHEICHPYPHDPDKSRSDPSRGLLAIMLFRQIFPQIHIVGFGGKGHNWNETAGFRWEHDFEAEHALINEWLQDKRSWLVSLDGELKVDPRVCETYGVKALDSRGTPRVLLSALDVAYYPPELFRPPRGALLQAPMETEGWSSAGEPLQLFAAKRQELALLAGALLVLGAVGVATLRDTLTLATAGLVLAYFSVCILSDLTTVILTHLYGAEAGFSKLSLVATIEFVKLFVSSALCAFERQDITITDLRVSDMMWIGFSAGLYAANNYLFYTVLESLDPTIFAIVRETSILWLCLLYTLILQRGLGPARWGYACLTVLACVLVHIPSLRAEHVDPSVLTALLLTCTSCAAAVVNEKALKLNRGLSINLQNALLYSVGALLALVTGIALRGGSFCAYFFDGFERWTVWVIACQSLLGLVASRLLKAQALGSTTKAVLTAFRPFVLIFAVPVFVPHGAYSPLAIAAAVAASAGSFGFLRQGSIWKEGDLEGPQKHSQKGERSVLVLMVFWSTVFAAMASGFFIFGSGLRRAAFLSLA